MWISGVDQSQKPKNNVHPFQPPSCVQYSSESIKTTLGDTDTYVIYYVLDAGRLIIWDAHTSI